MTRFTRSRRTAGAFAACVWLLAAGVWSPPARGGAGREFEVGPVPMWVSPVAAPDPDVDGIADARDGILDLLEDSQVRVSSGSVERYSHHVAKALTAAGLEQVSQVQLTFDPSNEFLVIHYIRIRRGA